MGPEERMVNMVDWKTARFSWWLPLCSLADGISVSRPAGSRNDARSVEPGKLLYRYTRPKGECTAKCCLCTCTPTSGCILHCVRVWTRRIHTEERRLFYIEVIHSKSRCRWRRVITIIVFLSSSISLSFRLLFPSAPSLLLSLLPVSRLALSMCQTHLTFTRQSTTEKKEGKRTLCMGC